MDMAILLHDDLCRTDPTSICVLLALCYAFAVFGF
jgi:hypothetical protein